MLILAPLVHKLISMSWNLYKQVRHDNSVRYLCINRYNVLRSHNFRKSLFFSVPL